METFNIVPLSSPKLYLTPELMLFRNCIVHVMLTSISHNLTSTNNHTSEFYELEPISFPIILSLYAYSKQPQGDLSCNGDHTNLYGTPSGDFLFRSPPSHRLTCTTQLYIDPKPCKTWNMAGDHNRLTQLGPDPEMQPVVSKIMPGTYLDPVFDSRILRKDVKDEGLAVETVSATKNNWVLIHVKLENHNETSSDWRDIFFQMDYEIRALMLATLPNKVVLVIGFSELKTHLEVKTVFTVFLSPTKSMQPFFHRAKSDCGLHVEWKSFEDEEKAYNGIMCVKTLAEIFLRLQWNKCNDTKNFGALNVCLNYDNSGNNLVVLLGTIFSTPMLSDNIQVEKLDYNFMDKMLFEFILPNVTIVEKNFTTENLQYFPEIQMSTLSSWMHSLYWETDEGHYFLSCTQKNKKDWLSLGGLISAFQWQVWLGLLVAAVLSQHILHRVVSRQSFWNKWTFVYSVILCQGTSFASKCKCIGGSWLLAGIVFSYAYQGDNIKKLTKPLVAKPFETFEELVKENFTIYTPHVSLKYESTPELHYRSTTDQEVYERAKQWNRFKEHDTDPDSFFSYFNLQTQIEYYWAKNLKTLGLDKMTQASMKYARRARNIIRLFRQPESRHELFAIMRNCTQYFANLTKFECNHIAYIDDRQTVLKTYSSLRRQKGQNSEYLHVGKSRYDDLYKVLIPKHFPMNPQYFTIRFQTIFHSGLLNYWKEWKSKNLLRNENVEREKQHEEEIKPQKVSSKDNIVVVFYLLISLLGMTLFIFIVELRYIVNVLIFVHTKFLAEFWLLLKYIIFSCYKRK